jgi:polyisoprenyl-teichoic acid--peptidoglycan teichoic acid transferase
MIHFFWRSRKRISLLLILALTLAVGACGRFGLPASTPTASLPLAPSVTQSATASRTSSPSIPTAAPAGTQSVWENFAAPRLTPVTPIPPPLTGLVIPEEVRVLVVAGVDRPLPYTGRTDAVALIIYHPRLARASLVSVPPDLFGYIPGYTMQRMYTAYAMGGPRMLNSAIEYNLGLRPDNYAVFNLDSFSHLVDDLGGIHVTVLDNVTHYCPDILPGLELMGGEQALCFMRLRLGDDEFSRNLRQQEILRTVFLRMVEGGNLVRVPELYEKYRSSIDSNLTLESIVDAVPLALKLGDPSRVGYFHLSPQHLNLWQISSQPEANVFLANRPAIMRFMQQAINFVTTPSPLSEVVITLEYELTISPTPTNTATQTSTPTQTFTPRPTITLTPTPTPVVTQTLTPTATYTWTPVRTWTQPPTLTNTPQP